MMALPSEAIRTQTRLNGHSYLIERSIESNDELDAFVARYLTQAASLEMPPVAASLLNEFLETTT
jgi:hypothetical protein